MTDNHPPTEAVGSPATRTAGAFDIRNIIGVLLGIYGVALLLAGIFADPEDEKTGGINANLWTGLALAVAAALFLALVGLRERVVAGLHRAVSLHLS